MKCKKGFSRVIFLVVVLCLCFAFGIGLWVVLEPVISGTVGNSDIKAKCLGISVDVLSINKNFSGEGLWDYDVVIKRNSGGKDFKGIKFVFDDERNSEILYEEKTIGQLETEKFEFKEIELDALNLNVAPFVLDSEEKKRYCDTTSVEID